MPDSMQVAALTLAQLLEQFKPATNPGPTNWTDVELVCDHLGLNYYDLDLDNSALEGIFHTYDIATWLCTDTGVGMKIITLESTPIAYTMQEARKSDTSLSFLSQESANKVRDAILDAARRTFSPPIVNPMQTFPSYYQVSYASQLTTKEVVYEGRTCAVIRANLAGPYDFDNPKHNWIKIDYAGVEVEVHISKVYLPLRLDHSQG